MRHHIHDDYHWTIVLAQQCGLCILLCFWIHRRNAEWMTELFTGLWAYYTQIGRLSGLTWSYWVTQACVNKRVRHCVRQWLVACTVSSNYRNHFVCLGLNMLKELCYTERAREERVIDWQGLWHWLTVHALREIQCQYTNMKSEFALYIGILLVSIVVLNHVSVFRAVITNPPGHDIFRCIFLNEKFCFWLKLYWTLFPRVQFTTTHYWFRQWPGAE